MKCETRKIISIQCLTRISSSIETAIGERGVVLLTSHMTHHGRRWAFKDKGNLSFFNQEFLYWTLGPFFPLFIIKYTGPLWKRREDRIITIQTTIVGTFLHVFLCSRHIKQELRITNTYTQTTQTRAHKNHRCLNVFFLRPLTNEQCGTTRHAPPPSEAYSPSYPITALP